MKTVKMKGKTVDEAVDAALAVLGISRDKAEVKVIMEGKPAMMGIIGGEEAEVEVASMEEWPEEARQILQNLLDKMGFLAAAEIGPVQQDDVVLLVKGEDMGRIIGKEGAMLKALETVAGGILFKLVKSRHRVNIDAGGYREKRIKALERLALEIADEVEKSGKEKIMPYLEASDRRIVHSSLTNHPGVTSFSQGEGKDRRMVIAPKGEQPSQPEQNVSRETL
jgi:spoIIIJ-associated protein